MGAVIAPLIFLSVVGALPAKNYTTGKMLLAEWCVLIILALSVSRNKYLVAFLLWCIVRHIITSTANIDYNILVKSSILSYTTIVTVMLYAVAGNVFKSIDANKLLNIICVIALAQSLMMVLQWCGVWIYIIPRNIAPQVDGMIYLGRGSIHYTGFMSNINTASSLIALSLPAFFRKKWQYAIPLLVFALIIGRSLGSQIPTFTILFVYLYSLMPTKVKVAIITLSVFASIFGLMYFVVSYNEIMARIFENGRTGAYLFCYEKIIPLHTYIGYGLGQFKELFPLIAHKEMHVNTRWLLLHNEYLQMWCEAGLIGMTLFIASFVGYISMAMRLKLYIPLCALSIAVFNSGVHFLFHTTVAIILVIYCSIIEQKEGGIYGLAKVSE